LPASRRPQSAGTSTTFQRQVIEVKRALPRGPGLRPPLCASSQGQSTLGNDYLDVYLALQRGEMAVPKLRQFAVGASAAWAPRPNRRRTDITPVQALSAALGRRVCLHGVDRGWHPAGGPSVSSCWACPIQQLAAQFPCSDVETDVFFRLVGVDVRVELSAAATSAPPIYLQAVRGLGPTAPPTPGSLSETNHLQERP
jgi:hypothetical protein